MGWASRHIELLKLGQTVQFRPRGNSMTGRVDSGDLVTVEPITKPLSIGDIVLCKVNGNEYLHLVKGLENDQRVLIGNNRGGTNGWTPRKNVFGICTHVQK